MPDPSTTNDQRPWDANPVATRLRSHLDGHAKKRPGLGAPANHQRRIEEEKHHEDVENKNNLHL